MLSLHSTFIYNIQIIYMANNLNWEILKSFSNDEQECFTYSDVINKFPEIDSLYVSKVLSSMVRKGMLIKLKHNLYNIVPTNADAETYLPDWHIVAKNLMKGKKYYIGYYSAMQVHGLITQPSLIEIIVTNIQIKPSTTIIRGVKFQFVNHTSERFFGYKNTWVSKFDKVLVSDLEKTIVDSVTRPHLCGGMVEVGKAIYETRERVNLNTLVDYFNKNNSKAAIKRYLFLSNLLGLTWTEKHQSLLDDIGKSYSLLDTSAPDYGKQDSKFGLKINIDTETIKNSIYT